VSAGRLILFYPASESVFRLRSRVAMASSHRFSTVDDLLHEAGRTRNKKHSQKRGFEMDHVVELQLVKEALNRYKPYTSDKLGKLVDFFNESWNLQEVSEDENRSKGQAVSRLLSGKSIQRSDVKWIKSVRDQWILHRENLSNFLNFKKAMNEILNTPQEE
jgi:hypothetical protein